ncbi:MAG: hypothetical protein ACREV9_07230 [Burkholderiales bacterium]
MKTIFYSLALIAFLLGGTALADDDYRAALFERFDANSDDRLSPDEFGRVKYDWQSFADADTDRSGDLDRHEFIAAPALLTRYIYPRLY